MNNFINMNTSGTVGVQNFCRQTMLCAVCSFIFASAITQNDAFAKTEVLSHANRSGLAGNLINEQAAHVIALKRYIAVNLLQTKLGFNPLASADTLDFSVIFPVKKYDRIYLLLQGAEFDPQVKGGNFQIRCYSYLRGKLDLLYQVELEPTQPAKIARITNLRNYLGSVFFTGYGNSVGHVIFESLRVHGRVSKSIAEDLDRKQGYVQYSFDPIINALCVTFINKLRPDNGPVQEDSSTKYSVTQNPVTNATIGTSRFYKQYGLPVSALEFAPITR